MLGYFPSLGGKGKDVQGLLKNSITLLGKDINVFKPVIYMTVIKSIHILALFFAIYYFVISEEIGKGFLTIIFLFFLSPFISYMNMKYKAITSWMIYDILRGKNTDVSKGAKELSGLKITIFLYSIIDLMAQSANGNNEEESGIIDMIKGLILSIFKEVWDLIKNFSLPAIVIDKTPLKKIPDKLEFIKKNVPAALVGVLGIDLVGSVFVSLFGFIQLPALLIGGVIGFYGKTFLPSSWLISIPLETPQVINMLPLFIILIVTSIFVSFLNSLVQLVKTTYFTTFYVSVTRPNQIAQNLRGDITHYLNFNDRLSGYKFFKEKTPKEEEGYDLDEVSGEDLQLIKKIANTFRKNTAKGLSEKKICSVLLKKGCSKDQLKAGLTMYRSKKG